MSTLFPAWPPPPTPLFSDVIWIWFHIVNINIWVFFPRIDLQSSKDTAGVGAEELLSVMNSQCNWLWLRGLHHYQIFMVLMLIHISDQFISPQTLVPTAADSKVGPFVSVLLYFSRLLRPFHSHMVACCRVKLTSPSDSKSLCVLWWIE